MNLQTALDASFTRAKWRRRIRIALIVSAIEGTIIAAAWWWA